MALENTLNGLTASTPENLQLDAGLLLKNVTITSSMAENDMRKAIDAAIKSGVNKIGATSGGGTFTHVPEFRNIGENIDGMRGKGKGLMAISTTETKLTTTLKEMTPANLAAALGAATIRGNVIIPKATIGSSDYITSLTWVGSVGGEDGIMVIHMTDVMATNGMNFTFEDKNEGGLEVEFEPFIDFSNPNDLPVFLARLSAATEE